MAKLELNFNSSLGGAGLFYGDQPELPTNPDGGDGSIEVAKPEGSPQTGDTFPIEGIILTFGIAIVLLIILIRTRYTKI